MELVFDVLDFMPEHPQSEEMEAFCSEIKITKEVFEAGISANPDAISQLIEAMHNGVTNSLVFKKNISAIYSFALLQMSYWANERPTALPDSYYILQARILAPSQGLQKQKNQARKQYLCALKAYDESLSSNRLSHILQFATGIETESKKEIGLSLKSSDWKNTIELYKNHSAEKQDNLLSGFWALRALYSETRKASFYNWFDGAQITHIQELARLIEESSDDDKAKCIFNEILASTNNVRSKSLKLLAEEQNKIHQIFESEKAKTISAFFAKANSALSEVQNVSRAKAAIKKLRLLSFPSVNIDYMAIKSCRSYYEGELLAGNSNLIEEILSYKAQGGGI